jgi:hypothetical protein
MYLWVRCKESYRDMDIDNKIIPINEIEKSPRGRHKEIIEGLAEQLEKIQPGFAIRLESTFGEVPMKDRNKISTIIRKHWNIVRDDKPSINYTSNGIPQVSIRPE